MAPVCGAHRAGSLFERMLCCCHAGMAAVAPAATCLGQSPGDAAKYAYVYIQPHASLYMLLIMRSELIKVMH